MTTDLGLEWISSLDAFGMLLCVFLLILGVKMRSFVFVLISSFGWMTIGTRIFLDTNEPLIFLLMLAVAFAQGFYGLKEERIR